MYAQNRCARCYSRAARAGGLVRMRRRKVPREVLLDEYAALRAWGLGAHEIADRLGMSWSAFERALQRARAAGELPPVERVAA